MEILIIGLVAAVGLIVASRFIGRNSDRMLAQYGVLEKRFRLERRTFHSKWGKGIGERHRLDGAYRSYPVALYSHFHQEGRRKQEWTSLTMELLFAGEIEFDIVFDQSAPEARFPMPIGQSELGLSGGVRIVSDDADLSKLVAEKPIQDRLARLGASSGVGVFRLSKGFLEYRESGLMLDDKTRERFQDALLISGDLADALSLLVAQRKHSQK